MKNNKGITLIALIITIIVMIILAGVALNLALGDNGIFNKAKIAKTRIRYESAKEILSLKLNDALADCESNNQEYNVKNIVRSLCEQEDITVDKYFYEDVATIQEVDETNITSLKAVAVSVDKYSSYKFLIEEEGKIEKATISQETDGLDITDFLPIEEFETDCVGKISEDKFEVIPTVTINDVTTTTCSIKVNVGVTKLGSGTIKYYYKKSTDSNYTLANQDGTTALEYTFENLEQGISYDVKVEAINTKIGSDERTGVETISLTQLATNKINFSNPIWSNGKASATVSTDVEGYTLQTSKTSNPNDWSNDPTIREITNGTTIYARLWDGTNGSEPATTNIVVNITGVSLNKTSITTSKNTTIQLTATVSPSTCECKDLKWTTNNSTLAEVSNTGLVTIKNTTGNVTITATSLIDSNIKATCIITVSNTYAAYEPFESFAGGNGTSSNPYQITNANQLRYLAATVGVDNNTYEGKYIKQMADIDLNNSLIIIGYKTDSKERPFQGDYNGNSKKISNISVNYTNEETCALFGMVGNKGFIRNLELASGTITKSNKYVGAGICGVNYGRIFNCTNRCNVTKTTAGAVGGVCGYNYGTIDWCINYGNVNGYIQLGGITGGNSGGIIDCCYNLGNITSNGNDGANSCTGGITGISLSGEIKYCYNVGTIRAAYPMVGGICGYNGTNNSIHNCIGSGISYYNSTAATTGPGSSPSYVGMNIGYNDSTSTVNLNKFYSLTDFRTACSSESNYNTYLASYLGRYLDYYLVDSTNQYGGYLRLAL